MWSGRTGKLVSRVAFTGGAVNSLACATGKLLVGDSQGHLAAISSSALLRGELHAISWRAHEGKAACLTMPHDGGCLHTPPCTPLHSCPSLHITPFIALPSRPSFHTPFFTRLPLHPSLHTR